MATREALCIEVDTSLPGLRVVQVLERVAQERSLPEAMQVDNGPEFISRVVDQWAYALFPAFLFTARFCSNPLSSTQCHRPLSATTPSRCFFLSLNPHKARVRRKHGRPPPNGFIERAWRSLPAFTPHQNARPIKL